jgi:5-methyltetrahydrofolate--homocysteine methyltransferase
VKIAPQYVRGQAVYVTDASRAVGVVSSLLNDNARPDYVANIRAEYAKVAENHAKADRNKTRVKLENARANAFKANFAGYAPPVPTFTGTRAFDNYDLAELVPYIDWTPFFQSWELVGRFPAILDDPKVGVAARALYEDARRMLDRIVAEKWLTARAVIGFWPANAVGDDIVLHGDATRDGEIATLHTLRQQMTKSAGRASYALSDFIAPLDSGVTDYVGGFCVSTGFGEHERSEAFKAAHDDYSSILLKALADRLAEALAERMHERVRQEFWAYAPDEALDNQTLIEEAYRGIRPAPGYPAQPDHTEKVTLFKLLDATAQTGVELTESYAMWPGAAVSGLYFAHPDAAYFGVGRIERDQVEDYARRKGMSIEETERWLAPVLNYDPASLRAVAAE